MSLTASAAAVPPSLSSTSPTSTKKKSASADRARRAAEARRRRILAQADQRMDMASGLAPTVVVDKSNNGSEAHPLPPLPTPTVTSSSSSPTRSSDATAMPSASVMAVASAASASRDSTKSSSGDRCVSSMSSSRRMAAMRRRRYKKKESDAASAPPFAVTESTTADNVGEGGGRSPPPAATEEASNNNNNEKKDQRSASPVAIAADAVESTSEAPPAPVVESGTESSEAPVAASMLTETMEIDEKKEDSSSSASKPPKKKYIGVAKMRRKMLKEQKQRKRKEYTSLEEHEQDVGIQYSDSSEMLEVTAEMVRKGENVEVADKGTVDKLFRASSSLSLSSRWLSLLFPPLHLLPRLLALGLLFSAGFDLGWDSRRASPPLMVPRRTEVVGHAMMTATEHYFSAGKFEEALTKPWEAGVGGKFVSLLLTIGRRETLIQKVTEGASGNPRGSGGGTEAIVKSAKRGGPGQFLRNILGGGDLHHLQRSSNKQAATFAEKLNVGSGSSVTMMARNDFRGGGLDNEFLVPEIEDEFLIATKDEGNRKPRGASETGTEPQKNIDPIFRVDLDQVLADNADNFPPSLLTATQLAVKFHRGLLRVGRLVFIGPFAKTGDAFRSAWHSWIENPPLFLGLALVIKLGCRFLLLGTIRGNAGITWGGGKTTGNNKVGGGKNSTGDTKAGQSGLGGTGKKQFDVFGSLSSTVKNYIADTFPTTTLVVCTMKEVVQIDMYVLFCGWLVGLTAPMLIPVATTLMPMSIASLGGDVWGKLYASAGGWLLGGQTQMLGEGEL